MSNDATVRVKIASVYNGPDQRNLAESKPGDIIHIAGGAYANRLVEAGFVEWYTEDNPQQSLTRAPGSEPVPAGAVDSPTADYTSDPSNTTVGRSRKTT